MAMYYQGSSEAADDNGGQIQTLHLMNPNYLTFSDEIQNHHQDNTLLLNNNTSMAAHQQFVGFTALSNDQEDHFHNNNIQRLYNPSTLELLAYHGNQTNMVRTVSPQQGLSLSLPSPRKINTEAFQKSSMNYPNGQDLRGSTACTSSDHTLGVILGSKYLKAAQELLDEVASVGNNKDNKIFDDVKDKAKNVITVKHLMPNDETAAAEDELTTAQRQEMQMERTKLISMLDEVDQRCRDYHHQMQITISLFEREAGMGSSRCYTQLALQTILKQFKRLKSAIISQIKSINKSLGGENGSGETFEGSRLKFVDHQLGQRRSSQQLAMMQSNAWRPQRGLPETAVSVLRAWLFEHFLHPYPKDSDKIMMAKQTGLTRNQVSNWFINARVRLWKPMVEVMYLEEMKNQEQVNGHNKTTVSSNHHKGSSSSPSPSNNNVKQSHHRHNANPISSGLVPSPAAAEISASSITAPQRLLLPQLSSSNTTPLKRPRNVIVENQENSPSSILSSAEADMKDHTNTMIGNDKGFRGNHHHDYIPTLNINSDDHRRGNYYGQGSSGFGNYGIGELSTFNAGVQIQANDSNNGRFSLSLALPPSTVNYGIMPSLHQDNFELGNGGIDHQTTRVGRGDMNDAVGGSSHCPNVAVNYELLDFYKRKRYASHQMLPDFVA